MPVQPGTTKQLVEKKIFNKLSEFSEFMSEMKELMQNGTLKEPDDFALWLEDVQGECKFCFEDLKEIVEKYILHPD